MKLNIKNKLEDRNNNLALFLSSKHWMWMWMLSISSSIPKFPEILEKLTNFIKDKKFLNRFWS